MKETTSKLMSTFSPQGSALRVIGSKNDDPNKGKYRDDCPKLGKKFGGGYETVVPVFSVPTKASYQRKLVDF